MTKLSPGDRIQVLASAVLGTDAVMATVLSVESFGYIVHCDGDAPEWNGPVDFLGNVLQGG